MIIAGRMEPKDATEVKAYFAKSVYQRIDKYKCIMDIPFDIWYMGSSDKKKASERLPMLNEVISFPALTFLNADKEVVRVHTGFAGPATSKYDDFVESFHETIKKLR